MGSRFRKIKVIETGTVYNSVDECAKALGLTPSGISSVLNGRQMKHRGYTFALAGPSDPEK